MPTLQRKAENVKVVKSAEESTSKNVAIVTFQDGTKCYASIPKHFEGETPLFCNDKDELLPGWAVRSIDGDPWLVSADRKAPALPSLS